MVYVVDSMSTPCIFGDLGVSFHLPHVDTAPACIATAKPTLVNLLMLSKEVLVMKIHPGCISYLLAI